MKRVVIAVPTIPERRERHAGVEAFWRDRTPEHHVDVVFSEAGKSWGAGLNDVYQQVKADPPDFFVCGSDDMVPADERWLPSAELWMERACYVCPRVDDPRFVNYGSADGPHVRVEDGAPGDMSTFPILRGDWLELAFPLPDDLHYFADSLIAARIYKAGIRAVAVPSCRIIHLHAPEGRGAGYGSENTRLYIDTVRYTRALEAEGIDRATLPNGIRGGMWEPHFIEIGTLAGA